MLPHLAVRLRCGVSCRVLVIPGTGHILCLPLGAQFLEQPGLAQARVANERHDAAASMLRVKQRVAQHAQFILTPDQRADRAARSIGFSFQCQHTIGGDRLGIPVTPTPSSASTSNHGAIS